MGDHLEELVANGRLFVGRFGLGAAFGGRGGLLLSAAGAKPDEAHRRHVDDRLPGVLRFLYGDDRSGHVRQGRQ